MYKSLRSMCKDAGSTHRYFCNFFDDQCLLISKQVYFPVVRVAKLLVVSRVF